MGAAKPLAITKRQPGILSIFSHLKVSFISFNNNSFYFIKKKKKERDFVLYLSIFYPYEIPDEIERSIPFGRIIARKC